MKRYFNRHVAGLAITGLALSGCVHEVVNQGVRLEASVLQPFVALGSVALVKFTNAGSVDVYLRSKCVSMKRKYGSEWRTPEPLVPLTTCANDALAVRRIAPGQAITEQVQVWSTTPFSQDVTGEFRFSYVFSESADLRNSPLQVSTGTFIVGFPPD